jgi:hypothetical protein
MWLPPSHKPSSPTQQRMICEIDQVFKFFAFCNVQSVVLNSIEDVMMELSLMPICENPEGWIQLFERCQSLI